MDNAAAQFGLATAAGKRKIPWYPTARLYRQEKAGDWREVLAQAARDLSAISGSCQAVPYFTPAMTLHAWAKP